MRKTLNSKYEVITGFKFAEISNIVFSGIFLKSQVNKLNLNEKIEESILDNEYVIVRKKSFTLRENDVIFCKTEYIRELFSILNKQKKFKNIRLITHQSDMKISKKMYLSKPSCISTWYSINVAHYSPDLVPIPIGIANFHEKNLNENDFKFDINLDNFISSKNNTLYLNFNENTNFNHRKSIIDDFKKFNWVNYDRVPITFEVYLENLMTHNFVLAPWGNGIDTHRFWEILYSGSIPLTKKHYLYNSFKTIPVCLVENYKDINFSFLEEEFKNLKENIEKYNLEELDFNYWKNKILNNVIDSDNEESMVLYNKKYSYYAIYVEVLHFLKSKMKIFNRIRRAFFKWFGI